LYAGGFGSLVRSRGIPDFRVAMARVCGAPRQLPAQVLQGKRYNNGYPDMPVLLDIDAIREILPHRYPFLLVDSILELEAERIVGIKNVSYNEPFMMGHFPDYPVMPGVLIVEAMAQVAGVLVLKSIPDRDNKLVLLVSIDAARFRRPVVPGDQLRIEMVVIRRKGSVAKMAGKATVDGLLVAEAELMCKLQDKSETTTPE